MRRDLHCLWGRNAMRPCLKKLTAVCLATSLVSGNFVYPSVVHAHPGGDRPHSLGEELQQDRHTHHHGHVGDEHGPQEGGHGTTRSRSLTIAALESELLWHLHASFLGFEITLPCSPPTGGEEHSSRLLAQSYFNVDRAATSNPTDLGFLYALLWASEKSSNWEAVASSPFLNRCAASRGEAPLCDTARHERSGVQLI
jgi:hypothetical protein